MEATASKIKILKTKLMKIGKAQKKKESNAKRKY